MTRTGGLGILFAISCFPINRLSARIELDRFPSKGVAEAVIHRRSPLIESRQCQVHGLGTWAGGVMQGWCTGPPLCSYYLWGRRGPWERTTSILDPSDLCSGQHIITMFAVHLLDRPVGHRQPAHGVLEWLVVTTSRGTNSGYQPLIWRGSRSCHY